MAVLGRRTILRLDRQKHQCAASEPGTPAAVTLFLRLPEDSLVAGELELLQAHCVELVDQVFLPAIEHAPGDDQPWP